ncbi:MAG: hypothetical protein HQ538_07025 [Parcubacteria group bacterium]|nr:hypothetical protein [Parcubacteria group bacterium]
MKLFTKFLFCFVVFFSILSLLFLFDMNFILASSGSGGYGLELVPSELPRDDIAEIIIRIVRYVVGLVGIILFVMLVYGGVMYMTSAGNEEQIGKAKKVLTYAIIGIIIVAFSFLITEFIVSALTDSGGGAPSGGGSGGGPSGS